MTFLRDSASVLTANVVTVAAMLSTQVLLARYLSVEGRGHFEAVLAGALLLALLFSLGWPNATVFRLRRLRVPADQVVGLALTGAVVLCVLAVAIPAIFQIAIRTHLMAGASSAAFFVGLLIVPPKLVSSLFDSIARGIGQFRLYTIRSGGVAVLSMFFVGVALLLFDESPTAALSATAAAELIAATGIVCTIASRTGVSLSFGRDEARSTIVFGLKSAGQGVANALHERIDIFLIALVLADAVQLGHYAIAVNVSLAIRLLPEIVGISAYPRLAEMEPQQAAAFAARALRGTLAIAALAALAVAVAAPWLIPPIFGDEYSASVSSLRILLPAVAALSVYRVLNRYFLSFDQHAVGMSSQAAALLINVILNLALIPHFGIEGAAAATLSSYTVQALIMARAFVRETGIPARETLLMTRDDMSRLRARVIELSGTRRRT